MNQMNQMNQMNSNNRINAIPQINIISQKQNNSINPFCPINQMIPMNQNGQTPSSEQFINSFSENPMNNMTGVGIVSGNASYCNDKNFKKNILINEIEIDKKNNEINKERNSSPEIFDRIENNGFYLPSDDSNDYEEIRKISTNDKNNNNNNIEDNKPE